MNGELSSTLQWFSETEEPIAEVEIATAVRVLRKGDDRAEPPTEWLAEVMAFDFRENSQPENYPWGTYYGPMAVWNAPNGTAVESPSITKVTAEMLSYWEQRAQEAKNAVLKAKYADLVWDFSKRVTGTSAHIKNAHIVIDSTILMASKQSHKYAVHVITKLERALSLAISINDNPRIARVAQTILDFEDVIAEDSKRGLWGFSYDLLWNNRKVNLDEEQRSKILSDLESRLQRISKISKDSTPDPWAAEAAALRLASHYRKENRPGEARRVLTLYGSAFEEHCKSGSPLQVSFWLQKVLSVYLEYGLKDEVEKIARKLREIGPSLIYDMKPFSHTMEISNESMDEYLEAITEGDVTKVLQRIATHFIPQKEEIAKQLRDIAQEAPLSFLVLKQFQDHQGRPVTTLGSLDEDLEGNLAHQMSQNMAISAVSLHQVLKTVITKFALSSEGLLEYLYESPLFQEDRKKIIRAGLEAYFHENHLVAIHLLTPQIEAAIRDLIEMAGGTVLRASRSGGLHLKTFDELLRDEQIKTVFGEDAAFYLRVLFTDQRGWNVRNNVCHGIIPAQFFDVRLSERIIHVLLCLALVPEKEKGDQSA
jgi:hypothetical protein